MDKIYSLFRVEKPTKVRISIPEKLLSISKPLIYTLRISGYYPICIVDKFKLRLNYLSFPFIWTSTYLFLLFLSDVTYYVSSYSIGHVVDQLGNIERLSHGLVSLSASIFTEILRTFTFLKRREIISFWDYNCKKLEGFIKLRSNFDFCSIGKHDRYFNGISCLVRRRVKFGIVFSITFALLELWTQITNVQNKRRSFSLIDAIAITASMFWNFNIAIDVMLTLYITFFLKVYCACFKIIGDELAATSYWERPRKTKSEKFQFIELFSELEYPGRDEADRVRAITDCIDAYYIVEDLVSECNCHFAFEMSWQILFSFIFVCARAFCSIFLLLILSVPSVLYMTCNVSIYLWKVYSLANNCSAIDIAVKRITMQLHFIDLESVPTWLQTKINLLALKISTERPKVSPGQFFTLNRRLLTSIVASMTTYLIILIQFQVADRGTPVCNCTCTTIYN
ncbi:unnamed protein product [Allacma fusca]|uniref:Gustatory receptor n=1 Tax=Allacma fusca TaxID=39272 RepID=A0A8J2PIZ6_9HEXA|nr:unnamed protein product [Allacma fusca]